MSFETCLSGLNNSSKALDVIGNNISNASTVGFKASQAHFADLFAAALSGAVASSSPGLGASTTNIVQSFKQGNVSATNNPLDVAIKGDGFFRLNDQGAITYTRNGQFHLEGVPFPSGTTPTAEELRNQKRLLANSDGLPVTGYSADAAGVITTSSTPQDIVIDPVMPASATTGVTLALNLDARMASIATAFDPDDTRTYNSATVATVFDSAGGVHDLSMYFVQTPQAGAWDVYTTLDDAQQAGPDRLSFDTQGRMTSTPTMTRTFTLSNGATLPTVNLDFTGTTQYASSYGLLSLAQDGYAEGKMTGVSISDDGTIQASFSNSQSRSAAQIVLAKFSNASGLTSMGNNQWAASYLSGAETLGTPGNTDSTTSQGLGFLQGSAVEEANIDLNEELVALIIQQRHYQANAQAIKAQDQILQTLAGIR